MENPSRDFDSRPKAMNGTIALVPRREISQEEIGKAENDLREKAKSLCKNIQISYWELGQCLYDVYDGVPGGYRGLLGAGARTERRALFSKWGYGSFAEYVDKELGLMKRSAENLRYAYYWFEIRLNLPKETKDKVKGLGRSKVYQLSGVVDENDIETWVEKASQMTHEDLKKSLQVVKAQKSQRHDDIENEGLKGLDEIGERSGDETPVPMPEEIHQFHTSLYKGQWDIIQSAIDRAKGMSGSDRIGHNLELICQDFLMNNEFGQTPDVDVKQYVNKTEKRLGIKLIGIDMKSGRPVYGGDLLWKLVQERIETEKAEMLENKGTDEVK